MSSRKVHVVSNTHWDREHRHGFQETRFMLVETIDRLIEILETDPEFKTFTFDGQSVWIEDYLEVKPQMRERLKALIDSGRIQIGPWYSLPDHFSSHPEALVRNLLIGHRLSEEMGGVTKFGYSIFSFSQIAQLPQIYAGFGVDTLIFYKLYPVETLKKSEFWWESPDGTKALCSRLGPLARANFYFSFTIPAILGGNALSTEEGSWQVRFTDGAKICRLIDDAFDHPHATELEQDIRIRDDMIAEAAANTVESAACESFNPDVLLGFDGNDFTMPLAELPEALRRANEICDDVTFVHSTPLDYFAEFREGTDLSQLPVVTGEMRYGPLCRMPNVLENAFLRVEIQPNGTVDVTDKESGKVTRGLNLLLDTGDAGDMWIHRKPKINRIISSLGAQADIQLMRNSGLAATFRVETVLNIPESLTQDRLARSEHTVPVTFTTDITLRKGSRRLEFRMRYNNVCKDHMLTVRFPAGIEADTLVSDVAFEVRERLVEQITDNNGVRGDELRRQPKFRFVDISDGTDGLAIFGKGQNEYEPHQFEEGAGIELTLMRAMTQTFPVHWDVFFSYEKEESQSLGEHTFEYALYFHQGDHKAGRVQAEAQQYITPVVAAQYGKGRFEGSLPLERGSFLSVDNPLTNVSTVKLAEDRNDALIVRVNNPADEAVEETLTFLRPIKKAWLCNMNEEPIGELPTSGTSVALTLAPYKIVTVMGEF